MVSSISVCCPRPIEPPTGGKHAMAIARVGVVGFGQMGSGIAQVCAMAGLDVVAREIDQRFIEKGFSRIDSSLARVVKSGKVSEDDATKTPGSNRRTTALGGLTTREAGTS